jgi:hypothetical protein
MRIEFRIQTDVTDLVLCPTCGCYCVNLQEHECFGVGSIGTPPLENNGSHCELEVK